MNERGARPACLRQRGPQGKASPGPAEGTRPRRARPERGDRERAALGQPRAFRPPGDLGRGGGDAGWRSRARAREGVAPAPPELIPGRLSIFEEWINSESGRGLKPAQQGALALARLVEILPFEDGNGRVSRLAASHLMVRGGLRPPILAAGDGPRLAACLQAAFRFDTEPLCALLVEASERCLDVMIQTLERG